MINKPHLSPKWVLERYGYLLPEGKTTTEEMIELVTPHVKDKYNFRKIIRDMKRHKGFYVRRGDVGIFRYWKEND